MTDRRRTSGCCRRSSGARRRGPAARNYRAPARRPWIATLPVTDQQRPPDERHRKHEPIDFINRAAAEATQLDSAKPQRIVVKVECAVPHGECRRDAHLRSLGREPVGG